MTALQKKKKTPKTWGSNWDAIEQVWVSLSFPHLHPVAHLDKGAGRVKGAGSAGVQVRTVVVVDDLHIVHAVGLEHKGWRGFRCRCIETTS